MHTTHKSNQKIRCALFRPSTALFACLIAGWSGTGCKSTQGGQAGGSGLSSTAPAAGTAAAYRGISENDVIPKSSDDVLRLLTPLFGKWSRGDYEAAQSGTTGQEDRRREDFPELIQMTRRMGQVPGLLPTQAPTTSAGLGLMALDSNGNPAELPAPDLPFEQMADRDFQISDLTSLSRSFTDCTGRIRSSHDTPNPTSDWQYTWRACWIEQGSSSNGSLKVMSAFHFSRGHKEFMKNSKPIEKWTAVQAIELTQRGVVFVHYTYDDLKMSVRRLVSQTYRKLP